MRRRSILTLSLLGAVAYLGMRAARQYVSPRNPEMARTYGEYLIAGHRRVLVLTPRLRDIERVVGQTLRLMARTGVQVQIVAAAGDGGHSESDPGLPPATHLGYAPADLPANPRLLEDLREIWRRARPTLVLAPDPTHPLPLARKPETMAIGRAALTILRSTADGTELVCYGTRLPNAVVHSRDVGPAEDVNAGFQRRGRLAGWSVALWSRLRGSLIGSGRGEVFRFIELPEIGPPPGARRPVEPAELPHP